MFSVTFILRCIEIVFLEVMLLLTFLPPFSRFAVFISLTWSIFLGSAVSCLTREWTEVIRADGVECRTLFRSVTIVRSFLIFFVYLVLSMQLQGVLRLLSVV